MLVIGLTGGIGSGKSTVANLFAKLGAPIIDTDVIARKMVQPGSEGLAQVAQLLGSDVITPEGQLDRPKVRSIVFDNPDKKRQLEAILHPMIRAETARQVSQATHPYCVIVIPLLAETWPHPLVQHVCVVDCDPETAIQRASVRDQNTPQQIQQILANQASREQRLALANDVIHNDQDLTSLETQVANLDKKYLKSKG